MEKIDVEARVAKAVECFHQGYNCAQSVAIALADRYGMDEDFAARVSASFGGGIGRMRETCGAACGMFMLAGLETDGTFPDASLKQRNYEVVQRLADRFRAKTGSLLCKELLGLAKRRDDGTLPGVEIVSTPEPRTADYYKKRPCAYMVETAVRVYCEYLNEKG